MIDSKGWVARVAPVSMSDLFGRRGLRAASRTPPAADAVDLRSILDLDAGYRRAHDQPEIEKTRSRTKLPGLTGPAPSGMTTAIWHNDHTGQPIKRSFLAYDR